jgi:hypothetical protein
VSSRVDTRCSPYDQRTEVHASARRRRSRIPSRLPRGLMRLNGNNGTSRTIRSDTNARRVRYRSSVATRRPPNEGVVTLRGAPPPRGRRDEGWATGRTGEIAHGPVHGPCRESSGAMASHLRWPTAVVASWLARRAASTAPGLARPVRRPHPVGHPAGRSRHAGPGTIRLRRQRRRVQLLEAGAVVGQLQWCCGGPLEPAQQVLGDLRQSAAHEASCSLGE